MPELPQWIDTQSRFDEAIEILLQQPALALDTESDSFFAYRPRVCLLQISVPGHDLLIDPLAGLDLSRMGEVLGDPEREIVLHAAENDAIALHHEFGWRMPGLFDTQVASFVLGLSRHSLAGMLEEHFDVKLDKREQRSDWSRRPLKSSQLAYAAEDTQHLLELAARLRARAQEAGRLEEVSWECRRIVSRDWEPEPFDPDGFYRMAGARQLDDAGLRVLRDLYLMRHSEAERRNRAAFRIVPDSVLVRIARERITRAMPGIPSRFWQRHGKRVAALVRQPRAGGGPLEPRKRRGPRGAPLPPEVKKTYERLRRWRSRAAEKRGVEPFVVARNELLMRIATARCATAAGLAELMAPFRFREYGDAMLAVVNGKAENA